MNNDCDLEEIKHVALQKFLELAKDPSKFISTHDYTYLYNAQRFSIGKFEAILTSHSCSVLLSKESLWSKYIPQVSEYLSVEADDNIRLTTEKDREEFDKEEVVAAVYLIKKHFDDMDCENRRLKMLVDMEASCVKIQAALKEPLKVEEEASKPKTWWQRLFQTS